MPVPEPKLEPEPVPVIDEPTTSVNWMSPVVTNSKVLTVPAPLASISVSASAVTLMFALPASMLCDPLAPEHTWVPLFDVSGVHAASARSAPLTAAKPATTETDTMRRRRNAVMRPMPLPFASPAFRRSLMPLPPFVARPGGGDPAATALRHAFAHNRPQPAPPRQRRTALSAHAALRDETRLC